MRAISRYAYLNTRVSGMAAQLLSDHGVDDLIGKADGQDDRVLQAAGLGGWAPEKSTDAGLPLEQQLIASLLAFRDSGARPDRGATPVFHLLGVPLRAPQSQGHSARQDGGPACSGDTSAARRHGSVWPFAGR